MESLPRQPKFSQETLATIIKIAIVISTAAILFFQDLTIIFKDALQNETTNYILVIPFLLAYLVYRKRKMVKASIQLESSKLFKKVSLDGVAGVFLFFASLVLYWYGSYTFTPVEYHLLALPLYVSACILILFNIQTLRQVLFPIAFLFLMVPPPEQTVYYLGALLSIFSSESAYNVLKFFGFPVTFGTEYGNPTIYMTQQNGATISMAVDVACSGIYSQIGFLIFVLFLAYIIRDKAWKKGTIFLLGFPLIYLLNVIRITTIGVIGYYYGEDLALNLFHLLGGWMLIFLGTLLTLATSEKLLKIRIFSKAEKCPECSVKQMQNESFCFECGRIQKTGSNGSYKRDMAKIAALILSVILISSIQVPVFALTEGPAEKILQTPKGELVTAQILPQIPEYTLEFEYRDQNFEKLAGQDASLVYAYIPDNDTKEIVWTAIEIASTRTSLHRWEACLITWPLRHGQQPEANQIELEDVQLLENPPIIGRYFIFEQRRTKAIQAVLYWYETSTFKVNATSELKHVKISLIAYPDSPERLPEAKQQLLSVANDIATNWQPTKTWSQTALLISQNGDKLIFASTTLLIGVFVFYAFERRKEREQNALAYQKLSKENQRIIDAVHQIQSNALPTLNNIAKTYANMVEPLDKEKMLHRLNETEKVGLIERQVANREDEPILTWKTRLQIPHKL